MLRSRLAAKTFGATFKRPSPLAPRRCQNSQARTPTPPGAPIFSVFPNER